MDSKLRVWFTEIGEPLPIEYEKRLHRYGMLTRKLAGLGHDVTWWTSTFSHFEKRHLVQGDSEVMVENVKLVMLNGPGYKKNVSYERIRHQAHFGKRFAKVAARHEKPDVIITPVPTLEVAEETVRFCKGRSIPVLVDIRDEWPDEFVDLAPKAFRPAFRIFLTPWFKKMRFICQNATGITGVSKSFVKYGLSFAGREQGEYDAHIPIGYSTAPIPDEKLAQARTWCESLGLGEDSMVCVFFGTIGRFFDLEAIIKSAIILQKEFPVQFVLCGNGSSLSRFAKMAVHVDNVKFPGWVNAPKIAALMEVAHVGLAPYKNGARMHMPNKPFEYWAGGLPIVSSIRGEVSDLLNDCKCGINYRSDSVEQFCNAIRKLYHSPDERKEMGKRGRELLTRQFEIDVICRKLNEHLVKVGSDRTGMPEEHEKSF